MSSGGASSENSPGPGKVLEMFDMSKVLNWSLKTNFTGSSKYGISALHSNILTFKLVLNSIERKERQKIRTNKGKHEVQKGDEPI